MIEFLSAASRLVATAGAAWIIGSTCFSLWCARMDPQRAALRSALPLLIAAGLVVLGHAGLMWTQALSLAPLGSGSTDWESLINGTHVGRVWRIRAGIAVLLLLSALVATTWGRARWTCASMAATYLALGPWGGHAAGAASAWQVMLPNVIHVLAISVWVGALPSWFMAVRRFARADPSALPTPILAAALHRFSRLAMVLMIVIVLTGVWLADLYIDTQGDLLGTRYGALILGKLGLLALALLFANRLRTRFLPTLISAGEVTVQRRRSVSALRHFCAELAAAAGVLICAAWLAQTTPALHEIAPHWWLPFRWSFDATWPDLSLRAWFLGASAALILAAVAASGPRRKALRMPAALLALAAAGVMAWAFAVPAYPGTYRRSQVPYLTLSVASGRAVFAEHCTACHGAGGLGDGALAAKLPKPPANLSEPHTALHTAGDMHWWLTHGIPDSGMPALGAVLSEDDRWDLINFMRAFSQGFESRVLQARVVPGLAWLGAINFYIEGVPGPGELKGYRDTHNVLLTFLGGPHAEARARTLAAAMPEFQSRRTQILAVPLGDVRLPADLPYPVLSTAAAELWSAYELLARTVGDRGLPDRLGMDWTDAEFLIDRFGYVRARWIAQDDPEGWTDPVRLYPELDRLNAEPRLRPPPDDHIH